MSEVQTSQNTQESNQQLSQETLLRLEAAYQEKARVLMDLREQLLTASESSFKAFQQLSNAKEQFLVDVIKKQNQQIKKFQESLVSAASTLPTTQQSTLPSIPEESSRTNNLENDL